MVSSHLAGSLAAAQVADRVAGVLVVLESGSSPAMATDIENVLQPLVAAHGDAVLYDLIEGIMQAMSRRGISERRQRSMVAILLFFLADPHTESLGSSWQSHSQPDPLASVFMCHFRSLQVALDGARNREERSVAEQSV